AAFIFLRTSYPPPPSNILCFGDRPSQTLCLKNVVENKSHFSLEVVDQDLSSLAMFTKHLIGEQRKRVVRSQWRKRSPSTSSKDGEDGGVKNKSSMGSRLIVTSEIVVKWLLEKLVRLPMCSSMVERMVDREEKRFLD
ncbi:hypothetical protein Tco_0789096, partial [Tanacetum coccineum]